MRATSLVSTALSNSRLLQYGMVNHHNICYANSVFACLTCIGLVHPRLVHNLSLASRTAIVNLMGPSCLAGSSITLAAASSSSSSPTSSPHIISYMEGNADLVEQYPEIFSGWELGAHEDAYEFLTHLLSGHHVPELTHTQHVTRWNRSGRMIEESQEHTVLSLAIPALERDMLSAERVSLAEMLDTWMTLREDEGDWNRSQYGIVIRSSSSCCALAALHCCQWTCLQE